MRHSQQVFVGDRRGGALPAVVVRPLWDPGRIGAVQFGGCHPAELRPRNLPPAARHIVCPSYDVAHEPALKELLSIGPAPAVLLRGVGIVTFTRFKELGSVETFRLLRRVDPTLGLQVLWRLESALTNTFVGAIPAHRRAEMLRMMGGRPPAPPRRPPRNSEQLPPRSSADWKTRSSVQVLQGSDRKWFQ